jgi:hypothetical protein
MLFEMQKARPHLSNGLFDCKVFSACCRGRQNPHYSGSLRHRHESHRSCLHRSRGLVRSRNEMAPGSSCWARSKSATEPSRSATACYTSVAANNHDCHKKAAANNHDCQMKAAVSNHDCHKKAAVSSRDCCSKAAAAQSPGCRKRAKCRAAAVRRSDCCWNCRAGCY